MACDNTVFQKKRTPFRTPTCSYNLSIPLVCEIRRYCSRYCHQYSHQHQKWQHFQVSCQTSFPSGQPCQSQPAADHRHPPRPPWVGRLSCKGSAAQEVPGSGVDSHTAAAAVAERTPVAAGREMLWTSPRTRRGRSCGERCRPGSSSRCVPSTSPGSCTRAPRADRLSQSRDRERLTLGSGRGRGTAR
jgi:hypothetical protein